MKQFQIKPVIECFDSFSEFTREMNFSKKDCVFTVRFLYEKRLVPLDLDCHVLLFEDYGKGEPTDEMIDRIFRDFHRLDCDRVIGIGGGSVLDIAKLLALKSTMDSALQLFEGKAQPVKEKELILLPTTCGTGSEMTCISITGIPSKSTKKGLAVPALFADKAVLIPELLYELPKSVLITSSLDALTHAMESFVAPRANAYSELFSIEAIRLILKSYRVLLFTDDNVATQTVIRDLLLASNYSGIAFGNAGVGAVHALAYPLGEKCHVFHGEACARFFNAVFQLYQEKKPDGKIEQLTKALTLALDCSDKQNPWDEMERLLDHLLPRKSLREYGMEAQDIELFADSVIQEQQRLLVNDYVELSRDEIRDIYQKLW